MMNKIHGIQLGIFAGIMIQFTFLIPGTSFANPHQPKWGYDGEVGPENWADISPEFSLCRQGQQQSPVDISSTVEQSLSPIQFNYNFTTLAVVNTGHSIQVNYEPGSSIEINGQTYNLLQFHFHDPSEHTINGVEYPLELHLVHQSSTGQLAVIGILIEEGESHPLIAALWSYLPEEIGEITVKNLRLNASAFLPENQSFYHYQGSLTTPPCSENVNWSVLQTPIQMSKSQIERFHQLYDHNARPVQPLNERQIQQN